MPAVSILDLRQIGLADRPEPLFLNGPHDFLLSHLPAKAAQRAFHFPQVPKFFTEIHIADCDITIAICNKQEKDQPQKSTKGSKNHFVNFVPLCGYSCPRISNYNSAAVPSGGHFAHFSPCHCDVGRGAIAGTQTCSGSVRKCARRFVSAENRSRRRGGTHDRRVSTIGNRGAGECAASKLYR